MKILSPQSKLLFFYEGGGRSKVLSQIHHCIRFSPGVIVLTGPTGSGRSLTIQALVDSCNKQKADLCFLSEDDSVLETEEELFRALADGFGLEEKSIEIVEDLVDRVQHYIEVGLRNKRTMLIIIDDVKQHSDEVLEVLLEMVRTFKGLSLLLSGESSLVETIKQFHVQSVLLHQIVLRPLLADEAFDFLRQYLLQQGISAESVLLRKKMDEIMSKTGGNLALLVREAQQQISGMRLQNHHVYRNLPVAHIVALIGVVTITALAFWYYPASNETRRESGIAVKTAELRLPASSTESGADRVKPMASSDVAEDTMAAIDQPPHDLQNSATPVAPIYTQYEQELLNRPVTNITLQVLSLSSETKARTYIDQSTLTDKTALSYYRRGSANNASYVVLYGDYPDKQKALQAQKMLPAELKKSAPWPRPISDIQKELKSRQ